MLRITCDIHRWMTAFVGSSNIRTSPPSGIDGTFTIPNVPAGTHTIQAWHEHYGVMTQTVRVTEGATSTGSSRTTNQQEVRRVEFPDVTLKLAEASAGQSASFR
jgi:hypothetical protein